MKVEKVFKRYDIRGDYPEEIDGEFSERLGRAAGTFSVDEEVEKVIVSRDNRDVSEKAKQSFMEGLRETGVSIIDIGEGTTDRLALAAKFYGGIGIQVTASHLSWDKTGFKFVYKEGNGFSNGDMDRIKDIFLEDDFENSIQRFELDESFEFDETYQEEIREFLGEPERKDLKVVLDCCKGAAGKLAPRIFEELGFEVVKVERDGQDPHPKKENRKFVRRTVEDQRADIGIGFDPDGDRVYVVLPEEGWIDGNTLTYALSKLTGAERIAVSVDSYDIVEESGAEVFYSRVGDIFVSELGMEEEVDLLAEPNGHFAFPAFSWYNSGILTGAYIASNFERFRAIVREVPEFYTESFSINLKGDQEKKNLMRKAKKHAAKNYSIKSTVDGVKFGSKDFTALVRPSGTSEKIRVTVYSNKREKAEKVSEEIYELFS